MFGILIYEISYPESLILMKGRIKYEYVLIVSGFVLGSDMCSECFEEVVESCPLLLRT